jgi:protein O-mannosyl-transferase
MKTSKRAKASKGAKPAAPPARAAGSRWWIWALGLFLALFIVFQVYQPAIRAPFEFDDRYLPFFNTQYANKPLTAWIAGLRPLLMASYWANFQLNNTEPYWYHVVNVLFHFANAVLIWLALEKILEWAGVERLSRRILAVFGGLLFLLHPLQTESVTYVASRSENQTLFFFNLAFVLFLYRRSVAVTWKLSAGILVLFGAACLTKENAAILPALLLLTDYFWNPGFSFAGTKRNWKLYAPIALGGAAAFVYVYRVLARASTAGFGMKDLTWYDYFFTQCRAIWVYIRMFFLPYGQNVDHDFAISRTVLDHGAIIGLLALLGLAVAAWIYRRRYPLAAYGYLTFLVLLAPTSSLVPIRDVLVERRMYMPFIGLILICCEFLRRWKTTRATLAGTLAAVIAVFAFLTYQRNVIWGDPIALWSDSAAKSPHKARPRYQLAYAYYQAGRCAEAVEQYRKTAQLQKPDADLYIDWGEAADCANQPDVAIDKFRLALAHQPSALAYYSLGKVYAEHRQSLLAFEALDQAQKLDPALEPIYLAEGHLYLREAKFDQAAERYRRALQLNPDDTAARSALDMAQHHVLPSP